MSIERERFNGPITFACDTCGETDETHCEDFDSALAKFKSHGGAARKSGDTWEHFCGECAE